MLEARECELAAAAVVQEVVSLTAVAKGFIRADGFVDWEKVEERERMLSGGERAMVDVARHLTGRLPYQHRSFMAALGRVDERRQGIVANAVLALFEDADLLRKGDKR